MQTKIVYLTNGEIESLNERRLKQLANDARYATVLGLFFGGVAERPSREEFGVSQKLHDRLETALLKVA